MRSIRTSTVCARTAFLAAFVFAFGFAGSAFAQRTCAMCLQTHGYCINDGIDPGECASQYNACARSLDCPLMPEM